LQSATSFGSICVRGLLARGRCGVPRTIGMTQSIKRPLPALASPRTKPACSQDAMISIQAGWRGAACTEPHVIEATTRIPRAVLLPRILSPCDACFLYSAIERQQPSNASQTYRVPRRAIVNCALDLRSRSHRALLTQQRPLTADTAWRQPFAFFLGSAPLS